MIPIAITGILLGPKAGALMGFFGGLFSFIVWTFMPPSPVAFVFTPFYTIGDVSGNFFSLLICFAPRMLVGPVAYWGQHFINDKNPLKYALGGALGSLTNTFLVLGGIYLFFGQDYSDVLGVAYSLLLGIVGTTILTNGIPEAILTALVATCVCRVIHRGNPA